MLQSEILLRLGLEELAWSQQVSLIFESFACRGLLRWIFIAIPMISAIIVGNFIELWNYWLVLLDYCLDTSL